MGASQSKNVTNMSQNLSNEFLDSIEVDQSIKNSVRATINLRNCNIDELNYDQATTNFAKARQIITQDSSTDLDNDLAQRALQEAESQVGTMGIGIAQASNYANLSMDVVNRLQTAIRASSDSINESIVQVNCANSNVGSINITQMTDNSAMNEMIVDQVSQNVVSNRLSSVVDQTATATVLGLEAVLGPLALIAVAVIIFFLKTALDVGKSGAGAVKNAGVGAGKMVLLAGGPAILAGLFVQSVTKTGVFRPEEKCISTNPMCPGSSTTPCEPLNEVGDIPFAESPVIIRADVVRTSESDEPGLLDMCMARHGKELVIPHPMNSNEAYRVIDPDCFDFDGNLVRPMRVNPAIIPASSNLGTSTVFTWMYLRQFAAEMLNLDANFLPGGEYEYEFNSGGKRNLDKNRGESGPGYITGPVGVCMSTTESTRDGWMWTQVAAGGTMTLGSLAFLVKKRMDSKKK